jgi:hypothetical protein
MPLAVEKMLNSMVGAPLTENIDPDLVYMYFWMNCCRHCGSLSWTVNRAVYFYLVVAVTTAVPVVFE